MTNDETEILKEVGFTKIKSGIYRHNILCKDFDFSSNSLEGIICVVYSKGFSDGVSDIQSDIKEIIGIK